MNLAHLHIGLRASTLRPSPSCLSASTTYLRHRSSRGLATIRPFLGVSARTLQRDAPCQQVKERLQLFLDRRAGTVRCSSRNAGDPLTGYSLPPSDAQRKTIYALATPAGRGGVAVIRVSGPDALYAWKAIVRLPERRQQRERIAVDSVNTARPWKIEPRRMYRCRIVDPLTEDVLDDGMAVFFAGPKSFTTEDMVELHVHSGRAVLSAVLGALARIPMPTYTPLGLDASTADHGSLFPASTVPSHPPDARQTEHQAHIGLLRPAERGEFTRRAFEGGKLDLTQVEALRDLINADTDEQRKVALKGVQGYARERYAAMRREIIHCLAMVEALIDFGDGEDIEDGVHEGARQRVQTLHESISAHLKDTKRGEVLRSGLRLAIFGPPNAGKSSLLNYLAQREAAIVTPIPGTTRDVLEITLDIGGLAVIVADTAGLRKTNDPVERIGVQRAYDKVEDADASLCVISLERFPAQEIPDDVAALIDLDTFVLLNKSDIANDSTVEAALKHLPQCAGASAISLNTGAGLTDFIQAFTGALRARYASSQSRPDPVITNVRHFTHLQVAHAHLQAFLSTDDVVLGAEELRYAAKAVGKVTGEINVEEILDAVFREFCIGK